MLATDAAGKGSRTYGKTSQHILSATVVHPDGSAGDLRPYTAADIDRMRAQGDTHSRTMCALADLVHAHTPFAVGLAGRRLADDLPLFAAMAEKTPAGGNAAEAAGSSSVERRLAENDRFRSVHQVRQQGRARIQTGGSGRAVATGETGRQRRHHQQGDVRPQHFHYSGSVHPALSAPHPAATPCTAG